MQQQCMGHCVWWCLEYIWCQGCLQRARIFINRCIFMQTDTVRWPYHYRASLKLGLCMFAFLGVNSLWVGISPYSVNLFPQVQLPGLVPTLARELEPFFWTRWPVLGLRPDLWTVAVIHLAFMTVPTLKMLESPVVRLLVNMMLNTLYWHFAWIKHGFVR